MSSSSVLSAAAASAKLASQRAATGVAPLSLLLDPSALSAWSCVHPAMWELITQGAEQNVKRAQAAGANNQGHNEEQGGESMLTVLVDLEMMHGGFSAPIAKLVRASLEERDSAGRTPLLRWAQSFSYSLPCGLKLLEAGADINAQDSKGNSMLHFLCEKQRLGAIHQIGEAGWLLRCDFTLLNATRETPLRVAGRKRVESVAGGQIAMATANAVEVCVHAHLDRWRLHVRPVMEHELQQESAGPGLIPDLAKMIMQYVDNSVRFNEGGQ